MPVNTAALKTFAPAMRRQLLEAVGRKLDLLLNSQTPDTLSTYAKQIAELREQEEENREQLLERVAYTWFNRLCALRYLDARGWHPFGCKVLMPAAEGETQPELLKLMRAGSLPAELKPHTNEARLHGLLDGQIPPAIAGSDPQGEVYRELVLASCRSYHQLLPELFEGLDDASELLLPDDLLSEGSIAGGFRNAISDADCEDVEIIGWLYQFYISEKKDQVIGKVVKSEDIPAATQLFTPNWIVKYMVQNTIGAQWLATYPDSTLREQMEFYIEPAEQTEEVLAKLAEITPTSLNPQELTLLDPACGSGHILIEAYNLFRSIYLDLGYQKREIPALVIKNNLFGLDICPRAVQMAKLSLLLKGREDDRKIFEKESCLNVILLENCFGLEKSDINAPSLEDNDNEGGRLSAMHIFSGPFGRISSIGSLAPTPTLPGLETFLLGRLSEISPDEGGDGLFRSHNKYSTLEKAVRQVHLLSKKYSSVATNPPYMGSAYHNSDLKNFLNDNYKGYDKDLFTCFIKRCADFLTPSGRMGFMTPMVWMFISSHKKIREQLVSSNTLSSLIQLEYNASGEVRVPLCSFTAIRANLGNFNGSYIRLTEFYGEDLQAPKVLEAINDRNCGWMHNCFQEDLIVIPGMPIAYWVSRAMRNCFKGRSLTAVAEIQEGLKTGDNDRFIRKWYEVSDSNIYPGSNALTTEYYLFTS